MPGEARPRLLVVTDLDGTLLDAETYDWSPAAGVLARLRTERIPLIIASSKTRAEIEIWRSRLSNEDPFIVENGGAVFFPRASDGPESIVLGTAYPALRAGLALLSRHLGLTLRGFGDLSPREISELTGLAGTDLDAARAREYDEPFVLAEPLAGDVETRMNEAAAALGLRITRGGRFHHLTGQNDKGRAVRLVRQHYEHGGGPIPLVALGDGGNDLELLREAELPVIVARPDGTHAPELRNALPQARRTIAPGPAGFAEALEEVLSRTEDAS